MEGVMKHRMRDEDQSSEFTMNDASRVLEVLGPMPREVLEAMVDYGLNDVEISRYFKLPRDFITILRQHWGFADNP
jgi:hypothetical protein